MAAVRSWVRVPPQFVAVGPPGMPPSKSTVEAEPVKSKWSHCQKESSQSLSCRASRRSQARRGELGGSEGDAGRCDGRPRTYPQRRGRSERGGARDPTPCESGPASEHDHMTDTMTNRIIIAGATIHHAFLAKMVREQVWLPHAAELKARNLRHKGGRKPLWTATIGVGSSIRAGSASGLTLMIESGTAANGYCPRS